MLRSGPHAGSARRPRFLHRLVAGSPEERQARDLPGRFKRPARRCLCQHRGAVIDK